MAGRELQTSLYKKQKREEHGLTLATMLVTQVAREENQATLYGRRTFGNWIDILNLLCWLPKGYAGVKSMSMYVCHILMIERFLVITFLKVNKCHAVNHWKYRNVLVSIIQQKFLICSWQMLEELQGERVLSPLQRNTQKPISEHILKQQMVL